MVGVQGSGKSFFAENYLAKAGYTVISNDKTGSRDKSLNLMKKALSNGKSVVVDNTHVNPEARKKFIDMAKQFLPTILTSLIIKLVSIANNIGSNLF